MFEITQVSMSLVFSNLRLQEFVAGRLARRGTHGSVECAATRSPRKARAAKQTPGRIVFE